MRTLRFARSMCRGIGVACLLIGLPLVSPADAAVITVTTTEDAVNTAGDCSLREAILAANSDAAVDGCAAGSGDDEIVLPAGTYVLTIPGANENFGLTGDLDISTNLTIRGAGSDVTIVDGGGLDRVFHIITTRTVAMADLTIRNGHTAAFGGGINGSGSLSLTDVVLRDNTAGQAGGMLFSTSANATLVLTNVQVLDNTASCHAGGLMTTGASPALIRGSLIAGNHAGCLGGGALLSGNSELTDTTVDNNTADSNGGGISATGNLVLTRTTLSRNLSGALGGGLISAGADTTLTNVTISGNSAAIGGGLRANNVVLVNVTVTGNRAAPTSQNGGGISIAPGGTGVVRNSIIAGNIDTGTNPAPDCQGPVTSLGYNLIGTTTGCTIAATTGDLFGTAGAPIDARLDGLADNGGFTFTHLPQAGSPAINAADTAGSCPNIDQRRFVRAGRCDIGATEADSPGPPLDAYLCYKARGVRGAPRFTRIPAVDLDDAFETAVVDVTAPIGLCSPAAIAGDLIADPVVHLEAYKVVVTRTTPPQPRHTVRRDLRVTNRFHPAGAELVIDTVKPDRLLATTDLGLTDPVGVLGASSVDHFRCYTVKVSRGAPRFSAIPGVRLDDDLIDTDMRFDVKKPTRLCLPVDMNGQGLQNAAQSLMCYQAAAARGEPRFAAVNGVHVQTQFGAETLDATKPEELCVPSTLVP